MFNKQMQGGEFKGFETVIGPSVKVKGDFHGMGNIIVEGMLSGTLKTSGNLTIGEKAKVTASIEAKEATIAGEIKGNIKTRGYLEITASAKIFGDVEASILSIEKGALINGKCIMNVGDVGKTESTKKAE